MINDLQELYKKRENLLQQGRVFIKKRKNKKVKRIIKELEYINIEIEKKGKNNENIKKI